MKAKIIAAFLAASLSIAAFAGCNTSSESSTASKASATALNGEAKLEKTTFNLGHLNSTAHLLGFVAKEEGYFEEEASAPFLRSPSRVRVTTSRFSAVR